MDSEEIKLYDGRVFALSQIADVSYKDASSRYGTYSFGAVKFALRNGEEIRIYPVADLESAGKKLSKLVYGKKD